MQQHRMSIVRQLNQRAARLTDSAASRTESLRIRVHSLDHTDVLDFGVETDGGLEAGLWLSRICLADLAQVDLTGPSDILPQLPQVLVRTDHPVSACLASQYAGWKIQANDYFGMGSGPMRALAGTEELIGHFCTDEDGQVAVGVIEAGALPTSAAIAAVRKPLPQNSRVVLAVAPTSSQAGTLQVVARSVETALHKLHELKFALEAVVSASGIAPLPPVAKNDLHGIGRTNDSILYGAIVNLWVRCEDELLQEIGPRVPSNASPSHGATFLSLFKAANHDFYAMDGALFSPAVVVFHNLKTGRTFSFGRREPDLLKQSFGLT